MSVLKPLFTTVGALLREHEQLLTLAKRKKEVLIKGDIDALNEIVKGEAQIVQNIERLESDRMGAGRLLAIRLGIPLDELTASKISAASSPEDAKRMDELTDQLRNVITELKRLNDLNKLLIEQSLQFVRTSIELLTESPHVPTYGGSGETNNPYVNGRTSYFDSKA